MNDLLASLSFQIFSPTYKIEPTFTWNTVDNRDPFENNSDFIKFEQTRAKNMLTHEISEPQLARYNKNVPEPFRIARPNEVQSFTYGGFIKVLYTIAKQTNLTKFNDIATTFNQLSKTRDDLWKEGGTTILSPIMNS